MFMKVAVSIPDPLFDQAEALVRQRQVTRSGLYAEALELLLRSQDDSKITEKLNEVYREIDSRVDSRLAAAQAHSVREEW